MITLHYTYGAVHKVRHARGGRGSEKVTVCDRAWGEVKSM